jgi:hypothetical protein
MQNKETNHIALLIFWVKTLKGKPIPVLILLDKILDSRPRIMAYSRNNTMQQIA